MSDQDRGAGWVQSFTDRAVWPLDPRPQDFAIEDIAHALACQNRFAGHTRRPYSVGEHSVRVSLAVDVSGCRTEDQRRKVRLAALLHDSPETYLNDLTRPVKHSPELSGYRRIEQRLAGAMECWAFLPLGAFDWPAVKHADAVLLMTEKRDLLGPAPRPWGNLQGKPATPLVETIVPWGWEEAEARFLARYADLTLAGAGCAPDPVGLHFHACPGCYEKLPCADAQCTIEPDLSENGVDFGFHARCDDCGEETPDAS